MAIKFGRPLEARTRFTPLEADAPASAAVKLDLTVRMRRNRRADWSRRMVRENVLTTDDLIWPLFIAGGQQDPHAGCRRCRASSASRSTRRCARPSAPPSSRSRASRCFPTPTRACAITDGTEALNADNLVCRAIRAIKQAVPEVGILCDVALDPYTSHGHDGLLRNGGIVNDETVAVLVEQALVQARGRLRHHRAVRHDGWPRRRDPHSAR